MSEQKVSMSSKECEKIIDKAVDPDCDRDQVEKHCRQCAECAAALACIGWLKLKGSPVADMQPSRVWLGNLEDKLNSAPSPVSVPVFSFKTALALLVGSAIVIATAVTVFRPANNSSDSGNAATDKALTESSLSTAPVAGTQGHAGDVSAPAMKFPSPSEDIDQR